MKNITFLFWLVLAMSLMCTKVAFAHHGLSADGLNEEMLKIGPAARAVLRDYLTKEYRHNCPSLDKKAPQSCHLTGPIYTGEALPAHTAYQSLPEAVLKKIGFIPPGAVYAQIGYTVYLISWPRKIVYDNAMPDIKSAALPSR